jgi:hypothetical protein
MSRWRLIILNNRVGVGSVSSSASPFGLTALLDDLSGEKPDGRKGRRTAVVSSCFYW